MGGKSSKHEIAKTKRSSSFHDLHFEVINILTKSFYIRNLVSKKRRRMLVEGYDLDMSYITDRLLAMSFPAEHMRAVYRNPLWQVKAVLDMRHQEHYKVDLFNLLHFQIPFFIMYLVFLSLYVMDLIEVCDELTVHW